MISHHIRRAVRGGTSSPPAALVVLLVCGLPFNVLAEGALASPNSDLGNPRLPMRYDGAGPMAVTLSMNGAVSLAGTARSDLAGVSVASTSGGVSSVRQIPPNRAVRSGLSPSPGVELQLDVPLHDHLSLGPLLRVQSWSSEVVGHDGDDQAVSYDVALAPRVRLPMAIGQRLWVAYLQVPIGLGFDDLPRSSTTSDDFSTRPSLTFGLGLGLQAMLLDHVGFGLAFEWNYRLLEAVIEDTHVMGDLVSVGIGLTNVTLSQLRVKPSVTVAF